MSWQAFSQFMWGISDLCFSAYDRLQQAEHRQQAAGYGADAAHAQHAGYDFRQHMLALAEATGIGLAKVHERRASFVLSFRGEQYFASAVLVRDRISVAVFSKIEFPISGMPAELVRAVKSLNAKLPRCDFEILDMEDGTCVWCAQGATAATSLTPSVFEAALADMVNCIARLDAWMVEHGFAR